jgi:hypothetical protein
MPFGFQSRVMCESLYRLYRRCHPKRWRIPHLDSSWPAAWAMSMPSWTTTEHISWMFCLDSGALVGVGVFELALAEAALGSPEADTLLEAAYEAEEGAGSDFE